MAERLGSPPYDPGKSSPRKPVCGTFRDLLRSVPTAAAVAASGAWERLLLARPARPLVIDIVSNWGWETGDDGAVFRKKIGAWRYPSGRLRPGERLSPQLVVDLAKSLTASCL